jgi:cytochrome oxidase Cu insertion factor (SCO1/SenC/PrrC family)
MIKAIGLNAKYQDVENLVSIFTTLFQGQKEAKTTSKTLWGYVAIVTMKYTLEQN